MVPTRILTTIRQDDGEYSIVIPPVAMKVFSLRAGDEIEFTPEKIETALDRNPELKVMVDRVLEESKEALEYLAHYDATGEKRRPE